MLTGAGLEGERLVESQVKSMEPLSHPLVLVGKTEFLPIRPSPTTEESERKVQKQPTRSTKQLSRPVGTPAPVRKAVGSLSCHVNVVFHRCFMFFFILFYTLRTKFGQFAQFVSVK